MEIIGLPEKFLPIWEKSFPFLKQGRPGDDMHAAEVVSFILSYKGKRTLNLNVLIPVAIMHDIGHAAILPQHFKYITGLEKLANGKLVHMLAGAKIAKDILGEVGYDKKDSEEIVDIISVHDADQLEGVDLSKWYNTEAKKLFHDIDCMDRYTKTRWKSMEKMIPDKQKAKILLTDSLKTFFFPELQTIAEQRLSELFAEN